MTTVKKGCKIEYGQVMTTLQLMIMFARLNYDRKLKTTLIKILELKITLILETNNPPHKAICTP